MSKGPWTQRTRERYKRRLLLTRKKKLKRYLAEMEQAKREESLVVMPDAVQLTQRTTEPIKKLPSEANRPERDVTQRGVYKRWGMDSMRLDDPKNPPPLMIDDEGFPARPRAPNRIKIRLLDEDERKVRFLRMYNYSAGNILLCCQEAGITRKWYETNWAVDPGFKEAMADIWKDVVDRAILRYHQRIGIVPGDASFVHDAGLLRFLEAYAPHTLAPATPENSDGSQSSNIPRATRPTDPQRDVEQGNRVDPGLPAK